MKLFDKTTIKNKTLIWIRRIHILAQTLYATIGFICVCIDMSASADKRHIFSDFMDMRISFILLVVGVLSQALYYLIGTIIPNFYKEYYLKFKYKRHQKTTKKQ